MLGIGIDAVDYEYAVAQILQAARERRAFGVSALAVHGVMTGATDPEHAERLKQLHLVVPDGQPVRWALNWLHGVKLAERVYGPDLTLHTLRAVEEAGFGVFLYGSSQEVLTRLTARLRDRFPNLDVRGTRPSAFRQVSPEEQSAIAEQIVASGARLVLVGLGCPRQEVWTYEHLSLLNMPMLAVGAAFDFHAGLLPQAPPQMQRLGLEWLFRLYHEPGRLWRRYLLLNPAYLARLLWQRAGFRSQRAESTSAPGFLGHA